MTQLLFLLGMALGISGQTTTTPTMGKTTTTVPTKVYPSTFWFLFPRKIRPGMDFSVKGHILKANSSVKVDFALVNVSSYVTVFQFPSHEFQPDIPETIQLKVPDDLPDPNWYGYRFNITGSGGLVFNDIKVLTYERKARSIFIQTDKALYKPGDTVKFRAVVMQPNLKVLKVPMDIVIMDPNNNRITQWLGVSSPSGIYEGSMATSSEPVLGDWNIKITVKGQEEQQKFTIAEYVLPKFEAKLDLPSFAVTSDKEFGGKVQVKYTFGKPVEGKAKVTMKMKYYYNYWRGDPAPELTTDIQVVQGEGVFRFQMDDVRRLYIRSSRNNNMTVQEAALNYQAFIIIANVTETITGKKMGADSEVTFYSQPYNVEFVGHAGVFKPGMVFKTMVKITKKDGSPLDSTAGLRVNISMTYDVIMPTTLAPTPATDKPTLILEPNNNTESVLPAIKLPEDDFIVGKRSFWWPRYQTISLSTSVMEFSPEGYIPLNMDVPPAAERIGMTAELLEIETQGYLYASKSYSPSNTFIQLSLPADKAKPKVGDVANFTVRGTENIKLLNYEVLSKGRLVAGDTLTFPNPSMTVDFPLTVTVEMAPSCNVLIYYHREDGEVVADSTTLSFDGLFDNSINLTFSKGTVKPGENVQLLVTTAAPDTLVSLLSVDKSVKLLGKGNDIDEARILKDLYAYDHGFYCNFCDYLMQRWWWPWPSSGTDAASVIDGSDMYVVTDANLYRHQREDYTGPLFYAKGSTLEMMASMDNSNAFPGRQQTLQSSLQGPERVRTEFPETFLWDSVVTNYRGEATLNLIAPDTITSWVTTGFGVHPVRGLSATSKAAELTTFLPLFVRPELPYSVIRGEVVCIQATAFNYEPRTLPVMLALAKSEEYFNVFMMPQPRKKELQERTYSTRLVYYLDYMASDTTKSSYFCIKPRKLGPIALNFTLLSWIPGDGVSKTLLVKPEGVPRSENTAVLIDLRSPTSTTTTTTSTFSYETTFTTPSNAVDGSVSVRVSIAGDILGPTLNNIGALVQMPYGCGEQNMVNFAPLVYIHNYLQRTNRLDNATKAKIEDYLLKGYQRELTYQHKDGSYSAFGEKNDYGSGQNNGSIWLTAFVTKCFVQASSLTAIEPSIISKALLWMINYQTPNGSFTEPGKVFDKHLQGGSGTGEALTAYVLITLEEARPWVTEHLEKEQQTKLTLASSLARLYLEQQLPSLPDSYELSIVTYALGLSGSTSVDRARRLLEATAITGDGTKHYERSENRSQHTNFYSWYNPTDAVAVEATAYALCDVAVQGDVSQGLGLMRWIANHRNPSGGFVSSQDTVIALQCLSKIAEKIYTDVFNMSITVNWSGTSKSFAVNPETSLLLQTQDLTGAAIAGTPQTVSIEAKGQGLAVIDLARRYHVIEEAIDESFELTLTVERETTDYFLLRACTAYKRGGNSSMALMEVGIPSGFRAELGDAGTELPGVSRKDAEDGKLILYFNDGIPSRSLCLMIPMSMYSKVANGQASVVKIYDYYQPKDSTTRLYRRSEAGVCDVCPECDTCRSMTR